MLHGLFQTSAEEKNHNLIGILYGLIIIFIINM